MNQNRDERVRVRAHQLWEAEGQPHGRDAEHWRRAEEEIDAEQPASSRAFADAADAPTGADLANDLDAASGAEPSTDRAGATHDGRITPAG